MEAGAVTWGNGLTGISGNVSPANSFVGFYSYNWIGLGGVTALTNGNYVICSPREAGYVTWGNSFTGIIGTVSTTNSLCGNGDHQVGSGGVKALTNGNYVVVPEKHPFGIFGDQFSDLIDHRSQNDFKFAANRPQLNSRNDFLSPSDTLSARNSG